ncbi:hyperosmotically inducible protein [Paraburkholderia sp. GAS199]|uniref:BON domain-containing protein n=1 Tax=Paraburkholderia sp. GAS199 TaxID=3035126 RepID=UPI003D242A6D
MTCKLVRMLWASAGVALVLSACVQTGPTYTGPAPPQLPGADIDTRTDGGLARAVRRALAQAPGFNAAGVFVRAHDGAVFLSGTVHSADQIHLAEQITRAVPGVLVVSNKLTLWHGGNG